MKNVHGVKDALGFDDAINYKTQDIQDAMSTTCPNGVDMYWDNVVGKTLDAALGHVRRGGRTVKCRSISTYQNFSEVPQMKNWQNLLGRRASMQGFIVTDHKDKYPEALRRLEALLEEKKLVVATDTLDGFEQLPHSLDRFYAGKNIGKQLVKNN